MIYEDVYTSTAFHNFRRGSVLRLSINYAQVYYMPGYHGYQHDYRIPHLLKLRPGRVTWSPWLPTWLPNTTSPQITSRSSCLVTMVTNMVTEYHISPNYVQVELPGHHGYQHDYRIPHLPKLRPGLVTWSPWLPTWLPNTTSLQSTSRSSCLVTMVTNMITEYHISPNYAQVELPGHHGYQHDYRIPHLPKLRPGRVAWSPWLPTWLPNTTSPQITSRSSCLVTMVTNMITEYHISPNYVQVELPGHHGYQHDYRIPHLPKLRPGRVTWSPWLPTWLPNTTSPQITSRSSCLVTMVTNMITEYHISPNYVQVELPGHHGYQHDYRIPHLPKLRPGRVAWSPWLPTWLPNTTSPQITSRSSYLVTMVTNMITEYHISPNYVQVELPGHHGYQHDYRIPHLPKLRPGRVTWSPWLPTWLPNTTSPQITSRSSYLVTMVTNMITEYQISPNYVQVELPGHHGYQPDYRIPHLPKLRSGRVAWSPWLPTWLPNTTSLQSMSRSSCLVTMVTNMITEYHISPNYVQVELPGHHGYQHDYRIPNLPKSSFCR